MILKTETPHVPTSPYSIEGVSVELAPHHIAKDKDKQLQVESKPTHLEEKNKTEHGVHLEERNKMKPDLEMTEPPGWSTYTRTGAA